MRLLYLVFTATVILCLVSPVLFSQIDITKYASEDLFEVKPVITQEHLENNMQDDVQYASQEGVEIAVGMDYWSKGLYDDAAYHFDQMARNYEAPFLYYYVGLINFERKRYEEASEYFHETLTKDPLFLEAKYMLGLISLEEGDYKTAKSYFKLLVEVPAYTSYGEHGLGLMALRQNLPFGATKHFKNCIEADSTFLEAYIPLITFQLYNNKLKQARKLAEKALRSDGEWQQGIIIRAMISLLQDQNTNQFEQDINTLIKLDPSNYHYYSMKAYLEIEFGRFHEAVKLFHQAMNIELDSVQTGEFKFSSKMKKEDTILKPLNYYFDHFSMEPEVREYLDKGICALINNDKKKTLQYLDSANAKKEQTVTYLFKGATLKSMLGKGRHAIEAFDRALELDSTNWMALLYRAEEHEVHGNYGKAFEDYSHVTALKPTLKTGFKNRGIILLRAGQYRHAYTDFTRAILIDTTDYDLFFNRAVASMNLSAYEDALFDLSYITRNKPEDGEAHYLLQQCFLTQGDTAQALIHLNYASKYSKYRKTYHNELLKLAMKESNTKLCLEAHDRRVKYFSLNYNYLFQRGKFLYEHGKYEEAITDLQKYVKRKKHSGEGFYYLANAFEKMNDTKNSEKYLKKAKKLGYK